MRRGMSRVFHNLFIVFVVFSLGLGMTAAAYGQITNGGFETGDFSGWSPDIYSHGVVTSLGPVTVLPVEGSYFAFVDTSGSGQNQKSSIQQTFTLPAGAATLTLSLRLLSNENVPTSFNDFGGVALTQGSTILAQFNADVNSATNGPAGGFSASTPWTNVSFNVAPYAGQSVTLTAYCADVGDGSVNTMLLIDNIIINTDTPPVAEPGGPYSTDMVTGVSLNGSGSSDPDAGDSIASYSWNINSGAITLTGATPSLTAGQVNALGVGTFTVQLTVTDTSYGTPGTASTTLTISKAASTTTIGSSQNPSVYGQSVTFTATVSAVGSGTPTGTVTFYDGATPLGSGTLSGGTAAYSTSALALGSHSITAVYSGDTNFNTSTSTALNQVVVVTHVVIPAATNNGPITLDTNTAGCGFTSYGVATASDPLYSYPYGLVRFTLNCPAAVVTITFPGSVAGMTYRKYGPTPDKPEPHWYDFMYDSTTGAEINGKQVVLHFLDGQRGDDFLTADGIIVDDGGPGQLITVPTMNEWGMIIFIVLAGLGSVFYIRRQRRA